MLSQPSFESGYVDLKKRIFQKLKSARIQHQIFEAIEKTFSGILSEDGIIVSRAERKRLLAQATKSILEDMLKKLDASSSTAQ